MAVEGMMVHYGSNNFRKKKVNKDILHHNAKAAASDNIDQNNKAVTESPVSSPSTRNSHNKNNDNGSNYINYWLVISFCINVLFLSALLGGTRPVHLSPQANHTLVNGDHFSFENAPLQQSGHICSNQGAYDGNGGCRCYTCFTGKYCSEIIENCTINFDHGDPKMFERFWSSHEEITTTVLLGGDRMSYFSHTNTICWFLEPSLASEIRLIHKAVGNAVPEGHHIIVGTGSSQLIHAALFALSSLSATKPVDVVSEVPFYSSYPAMTDYLQSGLHRWAGDAAMYDSNNTNNYIELITSPGNPDGKLHSAVVNGHGQLVHDLAYYWPHYTPISSPADYDIMLFTISKSTGHAGTRIGWALVRDTEVAKKMTKYIELNTIGVSKDSQIRASHILESIRSSYKDHKFHNYTSAQAGLFHYGYAEMSSRWEKLRAAVNASNCFSVESFPSGHCNFFGKEISSNPAFAWLRCEEHDDCHAFFKTNGILTRSGIHFGSSPNYIRISMVDNDRVFDLFVSRLRNMSRLCSTKSRSLI